MAKQLGSVKSMQEAPPKKRTFVWFTYELDTPILLRSVRSVRKLFPDANLIICDDKSYQGSGIRPRALAALSRMGTLVIPTTWPRRGNLRGYAVAKAIATTLKWAMEITGADTVIKIDSDVIMLKPIWIYEFEANPQYILGGLQSPCKRAICGPTYALSYEGVSALVDSYKLDMESPYETEEDFEMSSRLYRYCGGDARMLKVPHSQLGLHPEYPDAEVGVFMWSQNAPQWWRIIAATWQQVVFGLPLQPACKTQEELPLVMRRNVRAKAIVATRITQIFEALTYGQLQAAAAITHPPDIVEPEIVENAPECIPTSKKQLKSCKASQA